MLKFIIKRIAIGVLLVFFVLTLIFSAVHLVPGDPAVLLLSGGSTGGVSQEAIDTTREQLGLNQPLITQYLNFLTGIFQGDLGTSFQNQDSVAGLVFARLPRTLELVAFAAVISVAIGIPLGSWAATRSGGLIDNLVSMATSFGVAVPVYVLGTLLVLIFALKLNLFPAGGFSPWAQSPSAHLVGLVLPACSLAFGFTAIVARMTRSEVLETLDKDWVRTAKSIGLRNSRVFRRHVLRNSLTPVITVVGVQIGTLLGSTVLVERVFNYPGVSSLLVDAVSTRDYPVVQGIVVVIAIIFIGINILVDVIYSALDPRIRA